MTVTVANTEITNTFDYWRERTNDLAFAMSTQVLTTDNPVVGDSTIDGTFVVGNSSTNSTINSSSLSISNTTSSILITVPTPTQVSNGQFYLNANGSWVPSVTAVTSLSASAPTTLIVDSFLMSNYKAAEYLINVVDNIDNNFYTSKILLMHDTVDPYITEYAALTTNTSVGVFSATTNTTHVRLNFDPVSTDATVTFTRIIV